MTASSEMPNPGDIVLFAHATGLNKIITFLTRSRYYHVAIYAGDHHVVEARPQGVVSRDLRGPEGTHYCAVIPNPGGVGLEALTWAKTQIGAGYDVGDALVIGLERIFTHLHINYAPPGKFSCGEFVARAFQEAGVRLIPNRDINAVVPADFAPLLPPDAEPHNLA